MNLFPVFKEYEVKFKDRGYYYTIHVCKSFLKNKAFIGKSDNPYATMMQAIPALSISASSWRGLMKYWLITVKFKTEKLKRYLIKKALYVLFGN